MKTLEFFHGKKVLITGHTGFKGSWLTSILLNAGAIIKGYALKPEPVSLYNLLHLDQSIDSTFDDIRNYKQLLHVFQSFQPDIAIHMAAQPLVRKSYLDPVETYETNVLGTLYFLECVRQTPSVISALNVTTDKVYQNRETLIPYLENDVLNGFDPYSNSKSCSELITQTYNRSFFQNQRQAISTARSGNVIGGGDFSEDRIIPDVIRSIEQHQPLYLRNPKSIRPYQHVLEPLFAYLHIIHMQYQNPSLHDAYNVGPAPADELSTERLIELFKTFWGEPIDVIVEPTLQFHETQYLKLDSTKISEKLHWNSVLSIKEAMQWTVEWTKAFVNHHDLTQITNDQIMSYYHRFMKHR